MPFVQQVFIRCALNRDYCIANFKASGTEFLLDRGVDAIRRMVWHANSAFYNLRANLDAAVAGSLQELLQDIREDRAFIVKRQCLFHQHCVSPIRLGDRYSGSP